MVTVKDLSDARQRKVREFPAEIHGDLAWISDIPRPFLAEQVFCRNMVLCHDQTLHIVHGDRVIDRIEIEVFQGLDSKIFRDGLMEEAGKGTDFCISSFQFPDIGGNIARNQVNDGVWKYKNINRVVTVDLNSFTSFDSINTDTALSFAGKNAGYIYLQASGYEAKLSLVGDGVFYWTSGDGSYYSCSTGYAGIPCGDE